jgi:Immunoglobulin I-set domain
VSFSISYLKQFIVFNYLILLNGTSSHVCQVKQERPEEKAILHIPSSVRGDTGKYTVKAKNEFGEDAGDFNIIVLGRNDLTQ